MPELIIFFFGLAVGSFLNVLIDRLPGDESVIKGRSYCDHCKKQLSWYDLIPLVSFLFLRGKCRYCHFPISYYYPTVELVTSVMFVLIFFLTFTSEEPPLSGVTSEVADLSTEALAKVEGLLRGGSSDLVTFGYYLFIISSFIAIFFTDLKYGIIPDKVVFAAILVSFFFLISQYPNILISNVLSAFGAFLFFLLLHLVTRGRGMGLGDVKLVFLLGLFLGFPKVIVAFYIAFLTGAVVGCILVLWRKKKLSGGAIPFGPFLVLGAIIAMFWGPVLH